MQSEPVEFFKLDEIDKKVLLWLMSHVSAKSVQSWIDFTAKDYWRTKAIRLDTERLFSETQNQMLIDQALKINN